MAKYFVAALLSLVGLTGCRMCASPYDDCYPVMENNYPGAPADEEYASSDAAPSRNVNQAHYAAGGQRMSRTAQ